MDILLVEDDELILDSLTEVLRDAGFITARSATAEGALSMVNGHGPAVLVTDINLGPGMDGLTLGRTLLAQRPDLAVVYISGRFAELGDLGRGERFMPKPFGAAALLDAIRDARADRALGG